MSFIKFTLGDIRTSVRSKLGDTSYDLSTIDEQANNFQFELFNDNRIRFMEKSATLTLTSGQTSPDSFPSDFMTMMALIVYDSLTQYRNITKYGMNYDEFMQNYPMYAIAPAQAPHEWAPFSDSIIFSAPFAATYSALLHYLRTPVIMTTDTSECELPINYKEMMVLGTVEKIMRIDEDYDESDFEKGRLDELRTSFIRNYGRGSFKTGPNVIKQGRGRGTYRVDRDF